MKNNKIEIGEIIEFSTTRKFGSIKSYTGECLFFHLSSVIGNNAQVGGYVTFIKIPSKRIPGKFEAVNVTTAYLSKDGYYVVDRPYSHLHDGIKTILPVVIGSLICQNSSFVEQEVKYDDAIGYTTCVTIYDTDELRYAKREGREGHTKFVLNREPEPTNSITIFLKKTNDFYTIITAYFGRKGEVEPWDCRATDASRKFWEGHALIYGSETIDENSITEECPWDNMLKSNL